MFHTSAIQLTTKIFSKKKKKKKTARNFQSLLHLVLNPSISSLIRRKSISNSHAIVVSSQACKKPLLIIKRTKKERRVNESHLNDYHAFLLAPSSFYTPQILSQCGYYQHCHRKILYIKKSTCWFSLPLSLSLPSWLFPCISPVHARERETGTRV